MSIASYIKEIGRGKEGARSLNQEQAHDLMCQVLDGRVTDLEIGAFAIAMRIKGESIDELAGFLQAAHERCIGLHPQHPMVVLPSYNGARKLPNLTTLLALLLAQEGVPVLVHGPEHDPGRVTTSSPGGSGSQAGRSPAILRCRDVVRSTPACRAERTLRAMTTPSDSAGTGRGTKAPALRRRTVKGLAVGAGEAAGGVAASTGAGGTGVGMSVMPRIPCLRGSRWARGR